MSGIAWKIRAAMLLQVTAAVLADRRDTGELMHDISAPIYVKGRHWGAFGLATRPRLD